MDPWAFGWTQLFTIAGLLMTGGFAIAGLRTFDKWRREILEEKRIDIAFEALSIAYESKRSSIMYEVDLGHQMNQTTCQKLNSK